MADAPQPRDPFASRPIPAATSTGGSRSTPTSRDGPLTWRSTGPPAPPGYELKLNSYDLAVDIELADAIQRLRFEHPEVHRHRHGRPRPRVLLRREHLHARRLDPLVQGELLQVHQRDAAVHRGRSRASGLRFLAACKGTTAGGGYELALACDEIVLVDDGNSAVSFPETPLLGVLPGTGGLTRLVDKRKVRRDRADVFCTLAEGIKGKRAVEWGLVDALLPKSRFDAGVRERARSWPSRWP